MKKLLSLLATGFVLTTSCLNTNYVFSTINFDLKVKSNLKTNLKRNQQKLNSLLYSNRDNEFENSLLTNSNGFELKNYNSVFLKSLAYDSTKLKLTSTLTNLIKYDLKHHVSKSDTYLDKIDYLQMDSIVSKKEHESLINDNLAFLNHFFNDQSVGFNPNGYIVSRRSLLSTNGTEMKTQSVLVLRNLKKYVRDTLPTPSNNNLGLGKTDTVPKLSIGWSGVYFTTDHKILTHYLLNLLNTSSSYINAVTSTIHHFGRSSFLRGAGNGYFWDSWDDEQIMDYLEAAETAAQGDPTATQVLLMGQEVGRNFEREGFFELQAFERRIQQFFTRYFEERPWAKTEETVSLYRKVLYRALTRYAKENLGYQQEGAQQQAFDPEQAQNQELKQLEKVDEQTAKNVESYESGAGEIGEELGADATEVAAEAAGVDTEVAAAAAEATAASAGVPIFNIIVGIISLVVAAAIPIIIAVTLKKIFHWKVKNPKFPAKGPWSLKQIWFNQKTRMFRKLTSDEIQFNGHFFKPWFGKIKFHFNATRPIDVLPKYIAHKTKISANLHKTYNLITGTNNNFNLVIDPATLKQVVASSYLPNPEYNVKQVLAFNKLNYNNLNLSNENWIKLIQQIKHPYVNSNYAAILNYQNQKLTYSNIKQNQTTNFRYQNSSYLQEMIAGDNNTQHFIANKQQLTAILNDLENVKNEWNDQVNPKSKKIDIKGIKNSSRYNPDHYRSFVAWYYYHFLKPEFWVDSNINDLKNINFLTRIFTKFRINPIKLTFKQGLNLMNNNQILDLSSNQF